MPNVLLIVKFFSSRHFYYLLNCPLQLISVLVILILEFHTRPPVVLQHSDFIQTTLAFSTKAMFLRTFPFTVVFFIGNILVHSSSWTHHLSFFFNCLTWQTYCTSSSQLHQTPDTRGAPYRQNVSLTGFLLSSLLLLKWVLYVNLCHLCSSGLRNAPSHLYIVYLMISF